MFKYNCKSFSDFKIRYFAIDPNSYYLFPAKDINKNTHKIKKNKKYFLDPK